MKPTLSPIIKQKLSDNLAQSLGRFIITEKFNPGDRLPSITELASRFGVGPPTLREAIKKLETVGIITVKHGSGIYVGESSQSLFLANPMAIQEKPTKKHLLDLINARIPIELQTVSLAAQHATDIHLRRMEKFLNDAQHNLDDDELLSYVNLSFHSEIAAASGNTVLHQILTVITKLYRPEQQFLLHVYRSKEKDHYEHVAILDALRRQDSNLCVTLMKKHLIGVRKSILKWSPDESSDIRA